MPRGLIVEAFSGRNQLLFELIQMLFALCNALPELAPILEATAVYADVDGSGMSQLGWTGLDARGNPQSVVRCRFHVDGESCGALIWLRRACCSKHFSVADDLKLFERDLFRFAERGGFNS